MKAQTPNQDGTGQAEAELPPAGLTPDSPFYFSERFFEGVGTFFIFGDVAKAERYANFASKRIVEAKAVIDKGKPEAVKVALKKYKKQSEKSLDKVTGMEFLVSCFLHKGSEIFQPCIRPVAK